MVAYIFGNVNEKQTFSITDDGTDEENFTIDAGVYGTVGVEYWQDEPSLTATLTAALDTLFGSDNIYLNYLGLSGGEHTYEIEWYDAYENTDIPLLIFDTDASGASGQFDLVQNGSEGLNLQGDFALSGIANVAKFNSVSSVAEFLLAGIDATQPVKAVSAVGAFTLAGIDAAFSPTTIFVCDYAGANHIYSLLATSWGGAGSGNFTLGISSVAGVSIFPHLAVGPITWNGVAAATLVSATQAAFDAAIGSGNVLVSENFFVGSIISILIEFKGAYRLQNVGMLISAYTLPAGSILAIQETIGYTGFNSIGYETGIELNYFVTANVGAIALTGVAAGFTRALVFETGEFALSGIAAGIEYASVLQAAKRDIVLSGGQLGFETTGEMSCFAGAYALDGIDAAYQTIGNLSAGIATFTVSGKDAQPKLTANLISAVGAFAETGIAATFVAMHRIDSDKGAFVLGGIALLFHRNVSVHISAGAFVLGGIAATVGYNTATTASVGAFALSGIDASVKLLGKIDSQKGSFAVSGIAALYHRHYVTAVSVNAITLAGKSIRCNVNAVNAVGAFALAGNEIDAMPIIVGAPALYTFTGNPAANLSHGVIFSCSSVPT